MKTNSFLVGAILGAAATVAITKKFFKCCSCNENETCDNPVIKDADDAVEKLRNSVDSLRKELNSRIESEQTYAAKCEDLKDQVADKLNETAKDLYGIENFTDMIADETVTEDDPEKLVEFLTEKGHPALGMEPMM